MPDREPSPGPDSGAADPGADDVPTLVDPVMIAAFEGWNDAGEAASTALEHLELTWDATPLASIDPEEYYDFQVTRPHVRLAGGVTRRIEWQTTRLSVAQLPGTERHVVLVNGIEPNLRWRAFCRELLGYVAKLGEVAKLRPDSKLVINRVWADAKARLHGALQLSRGLAKAAG